MGLVIEKTKSFPCVIVKKTFQVTCGVASFQIQKMKLILFCRVPASSRHQKISMILQIAPLTDQISVLGGIVVPIADVGCEKKCPAMVKVGLSRFRKLIGELASVYHRYYSRCLENSYNLASVSRLLTTVSKITRAVRLKFRSGIGQQATKNSDRGGVF